MNQLNDFQKRLLVTFKAFDKFCQENDITYYAAYGTLIGVIRHKGFIPWDDDIDVLMKREDYNKILSLRDKLKGTNYRVGSIADKNYPYGFAKFYSTVGVVQEYEHFTFITGPWIDLFPMDSCQENDSEYFEQLDKMKYYHWRYRKAISYNPIREILSDYFHGRFIDASMRLVKKLFYSPFVNTYREGFLKAEKGLSRFCGNYYHTEEDPRSMNYKKEWFNGITRMPFEDIEVNVPVCYHDILTLNYGDYMQLPPEEKRVATHNLYFCDLNNTYTWSEIRKMAPINTKDTPTLRTIWNEIKHRKGF